MSANTRTTFEKATAYGPAFDVTEPYRWAPDGLDTIPSPKKEKKLPKHRHECEECDSSLASNNFETYCTKCGLIHDHRIFWHTSLKIEATRRQFDHDSEHGSGTLQDKHVTAVEDSVAGSNFDGSQLDYWVYPLDQYNDGRDGHRGQEDDVQKLNRERRFLKSRAEACATTVGLSETQIQEIVSLVISINSGAFTSYGPKREGGGQDAHIAAAIAFVGNRYINDLDDRVETREEFQAVIADMGMDRDDVRGALSQLHKQLSG